MKSATMAAVTAAALFGTSPDASAASNPRSADLSVYCTTPACVALPDLFDGRLEWYSGVTLVFSEIGTFAKDSSGQIRANLSGNGSVMTFNATYVDAMMSVFGAPDLSFKLFSTNGGDALLANETYRPVASALWAHRSEDAQAEISRAMSAEDTLNTALNIEINKRALGDSTFTTNLNNEVLARAAADTSLRNDLNAEITRAKAAEAVLTTNLNAEIARATLAEATELSRATAAELAEFNRATAAEAEELARALVAEQILRDSINTERDRATQQENADRQAAVDYTDAQVEIERQDRFADVDQAEQDAKDYADARYSNKSCPQGRMMSGIDGNGDPICTSYIEGRVKVARVVGQGTCTYSAEGSAAYDACSCSCNIGGWWSGTSCSCSCSTPKTVTGSGSTCTAPATSITCPNVGGIQGPSELTWCQTGEWDGADGCLGKSGIVAQGPEVMCSNTETGTCSCSCSPSSWWGQGWWGGTACSCNCQPGGVVSCSGGSGSATADTAVAFCAQVE